MKSERRIPLQERPAPVFDEALNAAFNSALEGASPERRDVDALREAQGADFMRLLAAASEVRERFHGRRVALCSIVNARSGNCPEDCAFCSQSSAHSADAPEYQFMDADDILRAARDAAKNGARAFSVVTSGPRPSESDFEKVVDVVGLLKKETNLDVCVSIGLVDADEAGKLARAGATRFHHNLEACRTFYPEICTTRTYDDNVGAINAARKAGLEVCSGGIFGMGESVAQRLDLLYELAELGVESVPLNFLVPIPGTPLGAREVISPVEALRAVALARLILPRAKIRICGGRKDAFGDMHALAPLSGADGFMIGNYLTTAGRDPEKDLELFQLLGLEH